MNPREPHRMIAHSSYCFPVDSTVLLDLLRQAALLKEKCGEPYSLESAAVSVMLDRDNGNRKGKADYRRIWGWTEQQQRSRWDEIEERITNWRTAYGRLSANGLPTDDQRTSNGKQADSAKDSANTNAEPTDQQRTANGHTIPTNNSTSNPPTPRAGKGEKSTTEKPWPTDYLPVRDLWESIHNGEAIGPYDATQLIELTNKHGPALVTSGLEWMGDEGKRKMTHLKDYLRRGEAPAVAPTASVEKHHGSGKQSGSTGYSEPKRKGYISAERGAELDRQYDEVGAEYRAMVARGADETPALAGYRDATGSVRSIPGMVDPTRIH